jgi:hypothetical protein
LSKRRGADQLPLDRSRIRDVLKRFDFGTLFIEGLGWDRHRLKPLSISVNGTAYRLEAIAEKKGMVAFMCEPSAAGVPMPDYAARRKIENQVRRAAHEHLIIYVDRDRKSQIWQWVRREPGRPAASREHTYQLGQPGDALIQKLQAISFSLDEEDELNVVVVAGRVREGFDVERVTRRFYDRFKSEHEAFLRFITGIQSLGDREWYGSLMLNRLMFVYFIQKKGFLDGDPDYLRNRLSLMRSRRGKDKFLSFYRHFLLRLFHEGLGQQKHTSELDAFLGRVPYLNGGLFDVHKMERDYPEIEIPDQAFEKVFDFFDAYHWHLDERPLRADNEINPDVLGYIFEKYINQKQMGAYYTKEDITGYIVKNTVIPFLLTDARERCEVAFDPDSAMWRLLIEDPDRYIYPAARFGIDVSIPEAVGRGLLNVDNRTEWNKPTPPEVGLPTETWREYIARRDRYQALHDALAAGDVRDVEQLITNNLNTVQFCQDVIENAEGAELVRAMYAAIEQLTVLDPACGSGAFLFAALNVLEPLYEACLDRMQSFIDESPSLPTRKGDPFQDFRRTLDQASGHPNRRHFILKSIVLNNLFGVDIMEEAVEICKLRLFLKLVAQVDRLDDIEPLPDIDFNIRAGNSLVGFVAYADVKRAITGDLQTKMDFGDHMQAIDGRAQSADEAFELFRQAQEATPLDTAEVAGAKRQLRERLSELALELDRYLAVEYSVDTKREENFSAWRLTHRPFHWFAEFYGIVKRGGFDVIIGNPPYVEYSKVRSQYAVRGFQTLEAGNLYAFMIERSFAIQSEGARFGMIVQLSAFCTPRMISLQDLWFSRTAVSHLSFFDDRPGKLFDGLEHIRVAIALAVLGRARSTVATTRYIKFATQERETLFESMSYQINETARHGSSVLKISSVTENSFARKLWDAGSTLGDFLQEEENRNFVYYGYGFGYWGKILNFKSHFKGEKVNTSTGDKYVYCRDGVDRDVIVAVMNSSLFYWFYVNYSDGHNFTKHVIGSFPFAYPHGVIADDLKEACERLMTDLRENARRKVAVYKATGRVEYDEFFQRLSKPIIDEIDVLLAKHYGFSSEEREFITNYDIKYRLGADSESDRD